MNGDGCDEILFSAGGTVGGISEAGAVFVFSGFDGQLRRTKQGMEDDANLGAGLFGFSGIQNRPTEAVAPSGGVLLDLAAF
jgi:hypothetical protein